MKVLQIYALGRDIYWLKAVSEIANPGIRVQAIFCPAGLPECLDRLPPAAMHSLILIDAAGQIDLSDTLRRLRRQGWPGVAVVSPAPSWRDAYVVFREARHYDYWQKSYLPEVIRRNVDDYLLRMRQEADEDVAL